MESTINVASEYVEGTVKAGYEAVFKEFEDSFINGLNRRAQVCAYVGDELVVDLSGPKNSEVYSADHI